MEIRLSRCAFGIAVVGLTLAGCGGLQPPIETPLAMPKGAEIASARPTSASYRRIFSFSGENGSVPDGPLLPANGVLYGTTYSGGASNYGTVFKLAISAKRVTETVLYSFKGGTDGAYPETGLTEVNGKFYGTTLMGGDLACYGSSSGCGTVFEISASGREHVLYSFKGPPEDGYGPHEGWSLANLNGTLYGTTILGGGSNHGGTIFKVTTSGTETVLYRFGQGDNRNPCKDGIAPEAGLTVVNGALYGTALDGGFDGCGGAGTVFSVNTHGKVRALASFAGKPYGAHPWSGLTEVGGWLYGTTWLGGAGNFGNVFKLKPSNGKLDLIYSFKGAPYDGDMPVGTLLIMNGALYGTTTAGGVYGGGTIFEVLHSGAESVLHYFGGARHGYDGTGPFGSLIAVGGVLYGTTTGGGTYGDGTVFRITP
jgi:uncharacterized repeat protein (TIGR03803 family)